MSEITLLLDAVNSGQNRSAEELLPLVYDELRHLAASRMSRNGDVQTLQPTALVHEAWLRLMNQSDRGWNNRIHFFRAAAQAMRHILVDLSRQKASLKRGSRAEKINLDDANLATTPLDDRILLVNEALFRLETDDPDSARLVTLKFFGGFTNTETAQLLGLSERTLERQWAYAKASLLTLIEEGEQPYKPPTNPVGASRVTLHAERAPLA